MATFKDQPRRAKPPNMTAPHSHTHENIRHAPPKVAAGDGHPRVHPAPVGPVPDKKSTGIFKKRGRDY